MVSSDLKVWWKFETGVGVDTTGPVTFHFLDFPTLSWQTQTLVCTRFSSALPAYPNPAGDMQLVE